MTNQWQGILDVLGHAGDLKQISRQGWTYIGVPKPESVADHSFRVAILVLLLAHRNPDIDPARALTIALLHDLPEAITGDITPFDQHLNDGEIDSDRLFRSQPRYSDEVDQRKYQAEHDAIQTIARRLDEAGRALVTGAWIEYERQETNEARLVRQADKLEAWLQALEYREEQPGLQIESFDLGTQAALHDPDLLGLFAAITGYFDWRADDQ